MKIEPSTCSYIPASALIALSKEAKEAIETFYHSDCDVSFGDANRTLLDIPYFLDLVERALLSTNMMDDEERHAGLDEIKNHLEEYRKDVYIDLEN